MMFRLRRPKRPVVHSRHGWPNRSWHIPALMGAVCLLLAASLALGVMELGTGGSAASIQEAAPLESAQEVESGTEESETQARAPGRGHPGGPGGAAGGGGAFGGFLRRGEHPGGELPRGCGLCRLLL